MQCPKDFRDTMPQKRVLPNSKPSTRLHLSRRNRNIREVLNNNGTNVQILVRKNGAESFQCQFALRRQQSDRKHCTMNFIIILLSWPPACMTELNTRTPHHHTRVCLSCLPEESQTWMTTAHVPTMTSVHTAIPLVPAVDRDQKWCLKKSANYQEIC
jgi:hypothetical protein